VVVMVVDGLVGTGARVTGSVTGNVTGNVTGSVTGSVGSVTGSVGNVISGGRVVGVAGAVVGDAGAVVGTDGGRVVDVVVDGGRVGATVLVVAVGARSSPIVAGEAGVVVLAVPG
jgi:hypothetical protein